MAEFGVRVMGRLNVALADREFIALPLEEVDLRCLAGPAQTTFPKWPNTP